MPPGDALGSYIGDVKGLLLLALPVTNIFGIACYWLAQRICEPTKVTTANAIREDKLSDF